MAATRKATRVLGLFYYVAGGLVALLGAATLPVVLMDVLEDAPVSVRVFFGTFGVLLSAFLLVLALCLVFAGRFMRHQRGRAFCLGMACILCFAFFPVGLVLGVPSLVILAKEPGDDSEEEPAGDARLAPPPRAPTGARQVERVVKMVGDTYCGPNWRRGDNIWQAKVVGVLALVGASAGAIAFSIAWPEEGSAVWFLGGTFLGVAAGALLGLFVSGAYLGIYRLVMQLRGRDD